MFVLPLPLFFAAIGAIRRGDPVETLAEVGGFMGLFLSAWLLNHGLKAQAAYDARKIARPPSIPRKLFAAALTGLSVAAVGVLGSDDQSLAGGLIFGAIAFAAQIAAFGLDPMRSKGIEGAADFDTERVTRAIDKAEILVREITAAADRIGERRIEARIERICDEARGMFRAVESDPRDLARARKFLTVYLTGLRDATDKFAQLATRSRDAKSRETFEALLSDLETSFAAHRADLLEDNRSNLDIEVEVLRERLRQDGLATR
jgi:5-bromo-4-chloroindolyl phosphate hydrolysis protein